MVIPGMVLVIHFQEGLMVLAVWTVVRVYLCHTKKPVCKNTALPAI